MLKEKFLPPDVFLVNPLGFWGAMMEEMSGYASGYSLAYGGDEVTGPDYQDYQGRARASQVGGQVARWPGGKVARPGPGDQLLCHKRIQ